MPNLSVEKIAGALAVLGTSVVMAACGGDAKPANAPVSSTETAAPGATGDATKAADGHCGAGKEHKAGDASCSAAKGGADTSAASTSPASATPAAATPSPPAAEAPKTTDAKTDPKKVDPKKPAAPATGGAGTAKKPSGSASCGAGTCAAKK